ncbi:MAG TPA: YdeI/OmpD-associated family protein [Pyrinomonadaceae bacterium]
MTTTKAVTKRFHALLEKHETSEATAIRIPFDVQKVFGSRARVPVRGTINGFPFRGSAFPMGGGHHYMTVNREIRAGAQVKAGDTVSVVMERDTEPRTITPPADLARALKANKDARAAWDELSYTHKKEYAQAVEGAKKPETRQRRVEKAVAELTAGKKPGG